MSGARAHKSDILQGTLDLMVLQTLDAMGPLHGYGVARRIEQISEDVLQLNQGTIYASLLRLQQRRWISASWGTSDNNRKAKFYAITRTGRKQLATQAQNWERISARHDADAPAGAALTSMPTWLAVICRRAIDRRCLPSRPARCEFDLEIGRHLDMLTEENIRRGLPPAEARRQAILRFGGPCRSRKQQHEQRGLPFIETTLQDRPLRAARAAQEPGLHGGRDRDAGDRHRRRHRRLQRRRRGAAAAAALRGARPAGRDLRDEPAAPLDPQHRGARPTSPTGGRATRASPTSRPTNSSTRTAAAPAMLFLTGFGEPQGLKAHRRQRQPVRRCSALRRCSDAPSPKTNSGKAASRSRPQLRLWQSASAAIRPSSDADHR